MEDLSLSVGAFYLLAGLAVVGAAGVAFSRNIIYSALSLMASFMGVAGIYVVLGADFVAGIQVLVYVGGVLVLTLFAVMLTAQIQNVRVSNRSVGGGLAFLIVAATFAVMVRAYAGASWRTAELVEERASTYAVGDALLGQYILPFEVASIVLLAVLVGAVVLSRKEVVEGDAGPSA
jgi:NAD(P)H-quinone oxidoreductase subunit 6